MGTGQSCGRGRGGVRGGRYRGGYGEGCAGEVREVYTVWCGGGHGVATGAMDGRVVQGGGSGGVWGGGAVGE